MLNTTKFSPNAGWLAFVLVSISLVASPVSLAQSGFYVVPLVTVEQVYDDNIFFDPVDEVSDYITRVSPQLDLGYESDTLSWLLSYRNDAEWYRDLSELDSSTARGFGRGQINYELDRRWTLRGQSEYIQTNSAQDLSLDPGAGLDPGPGLDPGAGLDPGGGGQIPGRVGRVEAERLLFGGGANYLISPRWTGDLEVLWVEDELIDLSRNETLTLITQVEQLLSPARQLLYGYRFRDYQFESEIVGIAPGVPLSASEDSNTLWVGLSQDFSERSRLDVRAGPRFADGSVDPYVSVNWNRDYARGSTTVRALWDETAFLGAIERQESRSIAATWRQRFSEQFELSGTAGYARLTGGEFDTDIASFNVAGLYRFAPWIFLTARYAYNAQEQDPAGIQGPRVTHNVASIAITLTRPRRDAARSPN